MSGLEKPNQPEQPDESQRIQDPKLAEIGARVENGWRNYARDFVLPQHKAQWIKNAEKWGGEAIEEELKKRHFEGLPEDIKELMIRISYLSNEIASFPRDELLENVEHPEMEAIPTWERHAPTRAEVIEYLNGLDERIKYVVKLLSQNIEKDGKK